MLKRVLGGGKKVIKFHLTTIGSRLNLTRVIVLSKHGHMVMLDNGVTITVTATISMIMDLLMLYAERKNEQIKVEIVSLQLHPLLLLPSQVPLILVRPLVSITTFALSLCVILKL